jgi:hypothetical protein
LESCDAENRQYMKTFDRRLLRPRVVPALGAFALRLLAAKSGSAPAVATR